MHIFFVQEYVYGYTYKSALFINDHLDIPVYVYVLCVCVCVFYVCFMCVYVLCTVCVCVMYVYGLCVYMLCIHRI